MSVPDDGERQYPWLPKRVNEDFDPLEHAGVEASDETPFIITPRGGAREVGRSCYQVNTQYGTYLVDCGLNQGQGGQFPDFRGLEQGEVDAVFLTHAHIDHCGGLPVLENCGHLAREAPIIATKPTAQLAHTMLEDSLKIHRREAESKGREQQFTQDDVDCLYERFVPVGYDSNARVEEHASVPGAEQLAYSMGSAGHLLGSAWLALETEGERVVFSGDLGGRTKYLPEITPPPSADTLITESTYGNRHTHPSAKDAQTDLFNIIEESLQDGKPVVIPTFAVGRAQMILLMLSNRLHSLSGDLSDKVRVVIDGMAQVTTQQYHLHVDSDEFFDESIPNRVKNAGDTQPFLPDSAFLPEDDADRQRIFEEFDPETKENIPIIVSPSGMLTGGNSPRYLLEFAARYDEATVLPTGYQAVGTPGRALRSAKKAGGEFPKLTLDTNPISPVSEWPATHKERVGWIESENGLTVPQVTVPIDWVEPVEGLSAHAAQFGLLDFAREVSPQSIGLVHGADYGQNALSGHLVDNVGRAEQATRMGMLKPMPISRDTGAQPETKTTKPEKGGFNRGTIEDQFDRVQDQMATLSGEIADAKGGLSEAETRRVVRDEVSALFEAAGIDIDTDELRD